MQNNKKLDLQMGSMREILYEVAEDVLEQFAFMFTDQPEPEEIKFGSKRFSCASILFEGIFSGKLSIYAPLGFCVQLGANVLGIDPDELPANHAGDALKELINVTCGELLVRLAGKKEMFNLTIPELESVEAAVLTAKVDEDGFLPILIDDQLVALEVRIERA